jgi:hypothetical protein
MRYDRNILHDERSALVQLKNRDESREAALIIHSTRLPFNVRTCIRRRPAARELGGGEIENSKSIVLHVHTQRTRRIARRTFYKKAYRSRSVYCPSAKRM